MTRRIVFVGIAVFWVIMNLLLWRAEFGGGRSGGSPVPIDVVLEKVLTSPDPSTLEVRQHDKVVGYVHWYPDPGEQTAEILSTDYVPEGMVQTDRGLQVRLEGSISPPNLGTRLRLDAELLLATNRIWEAFTLFAGTRQLQVTLRAHEPRQELEWLVEQGNLKLEHRVDLKSALTPQAVLGAVGRPLEPLLAMLPEQVDPKTMLAYDARLDWMPLGSTKIRIYRLQARWQDRYEASLLVNRAGEILRLDLPGGWRLVNEGLSNF